MPSEPRASWPFVGRSDELARIDAARRNGGRSVVIAGPSGVGKTRLARAAAAMAASDGWRVEWAIGTDAAGDLPLGAFLHLVPNGDAGRGEALLGAIVDALAAQESNTPMLLVVDDAHLLDPASATLTHRLALTARAFVVVTLRSGEPTADAIRLLWRDDDGHRIDLEPFDEDGTAELAEAFLTDAIDGETRARLWDATRGNALYVRELVGEAMRRGALLFEGDRWRWRGPMVASPALDEVVAARVNQLQPRMRETLEAVAVCEPIGFSVLQEMFGPEAVDALEREQLVEVRSDGLRRIVRCAHPLHGEIVRRQVSSARADQICDLFARALEATGARRADDLLRLAVMRLDAGSPVEPDVLLRAARQTWGMGHSALTTRLASALLARGPNVEASFLLGESAADRGDFEGALAAWAPLEDASCPENLRTQIAKQHASILAYVFERVDEAMGVLDRALAHIDSVDHRAVLEALRANIVVPWNAEELADPTQVANDEAAAWQWMANARVHVMAGRFDDVADDPIPIEDVARRGQGDWPLAVTWVRILRFFALLGGARFDAAGALARSSLESAVGPDNFWTRCYWTEGFGLVALERGAVADAARNFTDALAILDGNDNGGRRNLLTELAFARAVSGDRTGARAALEEMDRAKTSAVEPYVSEARARAALLAADGRVDEAADVVLDDADDAEAQGLKLFELYDRLDAARYGRAVEQVERMQAVVDGMQGPLPRAFLRFVQALARDEFDGLNDAAGELERAGSGGYAAEAAAAAARAARRAGRADTFALVERARSLAASIGNPVTPLLAAPLEPSRLTAREREVASLAARRRSDREIADTLGVSVRTVNAHLRAVYAKLGLRGRTELIANADRETGT